MWKCLNCLGQTFLNEKLQMFLKKYFKNIPDLLDSNPFIHINWHIGIFPSEKVCNVLEKYVKTKFRTETFNQNTNCILHHHRQAPNYWLMIYKPHDLGFQFLNSYRYKWCKDLELFEFEQIESSETWQTWNPILIVCKVDQ